LNGIIFACMEIIEKYFTTLSSAQKDQFAKLGQLYANWNEKVNVISRKDIANLYERHVLHSLAIAKIIQFEPKTQIMDVGTGGGFPGIPLAIFFPETSFYLIDSVGKKIMVVNEIVQSLGLKNVVARQSRFENERIKIDFVISRAVTQIPQFVAWSNGKIKTKSFNDLPNGILYLKGGNFDDELIQVRQHSKIYYLKNFFDEAFFETKKLVHLWKPS
jgi:16S rRNA (guanine527-N7)-methyltransferase